tara:strand:- start:273 stop:740 length:468 start_codon:yes stop_codon:yes gene_type:complete
MYKLTLILTLITASFSFSQQLMRSNIGALGGTQSTNGITLQSTGGQIATTTGNEVSGVNLRQGFIQPVLLEIQCDELDVSIVPNPNDGVFTIIKKLQSDELYSYEIRNGLGELIGKNLETSLRTEIDMQTVGSGIYYLVVRSGELESSFKIAIMK